MHDVAAEPDEELFEILDEYGASTGRTEKRAEAHCKGLWHRAVYCFVFDPAGCLLLQRRSSAKRIGPGQWDMSVAEHLQPGESYSQGACRGLMEELGIDASSAILSICNSSTATSHKGIPVKHSNEGSVSSVTTLEDHQSSSQSDCHYDGRSLDVVEQATFKTKQEQQQQQQQAQQQLVDNCPSQLELKSKLVMTGPLYPGTHARELHALNNTFHDCEFVQSYRLDGWAPPVTTSLFPDNSPPSLPSMPDCSEPASSSNSSNLTLEAAATLKDSSSASITEPQDPLDTVAGRSAAEFSHQELLQSVQMSVTMPICTTAAARAAQDASPASSGRQVVTGSNNLGLEFNPLEVTEVKLVSLQDVRAMILASPDQFTEWCRHELELLNYFGTAAATATAVV